MTSQSNSTRRESARLTCRYDRQSDFVAAWAEGVRRGTFQVPTSRPLQIGSPVQLTFALRAEHKEVSVEARVVSRGESPQGKPMVEVEVVADGARRRLAQFVLRAREGWPPETPGARARPLSVRVAVADRSAAFALERVVEDVSRITGRDFDLGALHDAVGLDEDPPDFSEAIVVADPSFADHAEPLLTANRPETRPAMLVLGADHPQRERLRTGPLEAVAPAGHSYGALMEALTCLMYRRRTTGRVPPR